MALWLGLSAIGIDWEDQERLKLLAEIRECRFVEERKNIILIGKPGTGKTHLANAIGLEAASKGYSVTFSHLLHNPAQSGQSLPVKVNSKLRVKSGHFSGAN